MNQNRYYLLTGAAGLEKQAEKTGKMPLMTTFSVYNLARNNEFDCTKAKTELGYTTRSYEETIHDEVQWMIAEGLIDGNGVTKKPVLMTNEQIREGGYMEDIIKAMEHEPAMPEVDVEKAYQTIEAGVVGAYEKIENTVVGGHRKLRNHAPTAGDFRGRSGGIRKGHLPEFPPLGGADHQYPEAEQAGKPTDFSPAPGI